MKIEFDKKLIKYSIFTIITAVIIYIVFLVLSNISLILESSYDLLSYSLNLIEPLLIGIVIAYLLYPITKCIENFLSKNKLYKFKKTSRNRAISILFTYLLIIGIFLGLILGIYFMIGGQISNNTTLLNISQDIYIYLNNNPFSTNTINTTLDSLNLPFIDSIKPYIINLITYLQKYIENNLGNMTVYIMSIGSSIATFFIAFIISIYLLKDSEYFIGLWKKLYYLLLGKNISSKISYIFKVLHEVFSKYLRGQLLEAFFVGVLSAIGLSIIGIDYAFIIGIIAGLSNMIPYVGPVVGTILAAIMALLSGSPIKILYAIITMLIVQQIDNNFLAPKIVGNSVGLHEVFTILAILIGGNVGGLLGMLLAVPLAASFKVFFNNWYDNHINKTKQT